MQLEPGCLLLLLALPLLYGYACTVTLARTPKYIIASYPQTTPSRPKIVSIIADIGSRPCCALVQALMWLLSFEDVRKFTQVLLALGYWSGRGGREKESSGEGYGGGEG